MGTKMAVAFTNIFIANIETQILSQSVQKPTIWERYIDDIFRSVRHQQNSSGMLRHVL